MRDETRGPQGTGVMEEQEVHERERGRGPALSTADLASSAQQREQRPMPQEVRQATGPVPAQDMPDARSAAAQQSAPEHTPLLPEQEVQNLRSHWQRIQVAFVDSPHEAVQEADGLVAETMKRLAEVFAAERAELESQWSRGQDVSTEDLRQALQRYRSFFGRLLSV